MAVLDSYGVRSHERERERVQLAILKLSDGSLEALHHYVAAAKRDYRDVLYWRNTCPPEYMPPRAKGRGSHRWLPRPFAIVP